MANSFTKTYQDGDPLLEDDLDNGFESVQPSVDNLALATTGSVSGYLLASTGSNLAPAFVSPDTVGANMTSTGANAIFADVSTCTTSVAFVIAQAMDASAANLIGVTMGASGANAIIADANSLSVPAAVFANNLLAAVTITTSAASNVIADGVVRAVSSTAGHLGVGLSTGSGAFTTTNSTFTDVPNLAATITTNGRPVCLKCVGTTDASSSYFIESGSTGMVGQAIDF
jgi:hypothetical protein